MHTKDRLKQLRFKFGLTQQQLILCLTTIHIIVYGVKKKKID